MLGLKSRPSVHVDIEYEQRYVIRHWLIESITKEADEYFRKNNKIATRILSKYFIGYEKKHITSIDTPYGRLEVVVDPELDCLLKVE